MKLPASKNGGATTTMLLIMSTPQSSLSMPYSSPRQLALSSHHHPTHHSRERPINSGHRSPKGKPSKKKRRGIGKRPASSPPFGARFSGINSHQQQQHQQPR